MRAEFGTLRQNTVTEIFNSSLSRSGITRAEIAKLSGLSVMTAGKAVDALISLDILCQSRSSDPNPGRPTRAVYPSRHKWSAVYLISESLFSFYMLDLSQRIIDSFEYEPVSAAFPDDEVKYFAHLASVFSSSRRKSADCIACGILAPCGYDAERDKLTGSGMLLSKIRPAALLEGYCFNRTPYIGNTRIFNSARIGRGLSEGAFAIVFYLDRGDIKSSVLSKGLCSHREIHLYDAGAFRVRGGRSLCEFSMFADDIEDLCRGLCELIMTAVCALGINTVVLCGTVCSDFKSFRDAVGDMVYRACANDGVIPPEIISGSEGEEAAKGISEEMRNKWFFEEILDSY